ncbi:MULTISPECIES: phage virion morphogenesis protein [Paracoccus]|uniref:phage virion morphogenesis protein n=1 Tax=Paracoccus TaxID=265 RepID=UPI0039BFFCCA
MVLSAGRNFKAQSAPDGTPWKPLAPATIKARAGPPTRAGPIVQPRPAAWDDSIRRTTPADQPRNHAPHPLQAADPQGAQALGADLRSQLRNL